MSSAQPIHVAHVITRLNVGGAAVQVVLATQALRDRRHRAVLVRGELSASEASMDYFAEAHGVPVVEIAGLRRDCGFGDVMALWRLIRVLHRERPDIVHTHTAKAGTLGRLAALITGIPVRVHTFHGNVFDGYFARPLSWAIRSAERVLAHGTDCLIAISELQRRQLVETYRIAPAEKVVSIPLALEMKNLLLIEGHNGRLRADLRCLPGEILVGWVGRFTAIKAPELFLDCAKLIAANCGCRFVMVGDGELRAECERRIQSLGLRSQLTVTGWQRELAETYADLDVVVLTSKNEGTPLTLLEAMAAGRPFVAADAGGVRDLVVGTAQKGNGFEAFENGIVVRVGDAEALANAVHYLIGNPELRRAMGTKGRHFVEESFSRDRLASNLEHLYQDLLRRKEARWGGGSR